MQGKISGSYLFSCPDNLTSSLFMKELAKVLLQINTKDAEGLIAKIEAGTHPDVLVYPKGKIFMVEDAADIYDKVQVKPMLADYKVFIINNIDDATEQAQNKMLKIIEEPPANVVFFMSQKHDGEVLQTIASRSQKRVIGKIDNKLLYELLSKEEVEKQKLAIFLGEGYLGKTLEIIENDEFIQNYKNCLNILKNLKKSEQIVDFSGVISKNRDMFFTFLENISKFIRDILMIKLNKKDLVVNQNIMSDLNEISNEFSAGMLVEIINRLNLAKRKLDGNVNLVSLADNLLLEILEVKFLCK